MNLDGSEARLFKSGAFEGKYSGDGSKIIFGRQPTLLGSALYVASADGSNETRVPTPQRAPAFHASFNPTNNSEVVFTAFTESPTIWLQLVNGTHAHALSKAPLLVDAASYDPTGFQIVYSGTQPGSLTFAIFKGDIIGTANQQIIVVPVSLLAGIPLFLDPVFSPDGKTIACICEPPMP
jgi:Tol biopolymer transport system component